MAWLTKKSDLAAGQELPPTKPYVADTPMEAESDLQKISEEPHGAIDPKLAPRPIPSPRG